MDINIVYTRGISSNFNQSIAIAGAVYNIIFFTKVNARALILTRLISHFCTSIPAGQKGYYQSK